VDRTGEESAPDWQSDMLDVSDMSLEELTARDKDAIPADSALALSLRRLAAQSGEPIAGFNSAL
jgi:FXSXX-COOH protein